MRLRRLLALLLIPAAVGTAGPGRAAAAPGPTLDVDTSVAGVVAVTVHTDQDWVSAQLVDAETPTFTGPWVHRAVPAGSDSVRLELESWGFGDGDLLRVQECTHEGWNCSTDVSVEVSPTDVDPVVTWPEQTRIGGTNAPYVVSVSDPGGGGRLVAGFQYGEPLARTGETTLALMGADGVGEIVVSRCASNGYACTETGVRSPEIEVHTPGYVGYDLDPTLGVLRPTPGGKPDLTLSVFAVQAGDYLLDWWIAGTTVGRQGIPVTLDGEHSLPLALELGGLPSGVHTPRIRLTREFPGFGPIVSTSDAAGVPTFRVDVTPPGGRLVLSATTFAPHPDGYRDSVELDVRTEWGARYRIEVRDRASRVVRTFAGTSYGNAVVAWNGKVPGGSYAPAGAYTLHATTTDDAGNRSTLPVVGLSVTSERLVTRTFRRTVTPASTVVDRSVGRCSRLQARPRGWKGGLGLYTNTRCDGDFDASLVATTHALKVPRALRYGALRISAFGGGARIQPGSYLFLDQLTARRTWGKNDVRLHYRLGSHPGRTRDGDGFVLDDGRIYWGVYTYSGAAYDLRSFTVTLSYELLVR